MIDLSGIVFAQARLYVCHVRPLSYMKNAAPEAVKVGVSDNPERRKWKLHRPGSDKPRIVWTTDEMDRMRAYRIEALVKRHLAHKCVCGTEWFDVTPQVAARTIRQMAALVAESERTGIAVRHLYRRLGARGTAPFTGGPRKRGKA